MFLDFAAGGFRVIAPDLLGYGYSDKPRDLDYTIARQAEMVVDFMKQLGVERAVLVGSSYGAAVAATVALDQIEVRSLLEAASAAVAKTLDDFLLARDDAGHV